MGKEKKTEEVVVPIEKTVKRPFMKALSMIAIPLSICVTLIGILMYMSFYMEVVTLAKEVTDEEWVEYGKDYKRESMSFYAGYKSYDDYVDRKWEEDYEKLPIAETICIGVGIGIVGIVSKKAYKAGQEE